MADLSNLKKKKNRFGSPPKKEEAGNNLEAPETAPISPDSNDKTVSRPARKTGRTEAFGTRVSREFLQDFKRIAFEDDLKKVELLEKSLEAYKAQRKS